MIRIGFHVSIAGSVANAPKFAEGNGFGAFQIFTTSARAWRNSDIKEIDSLEFIKRTQNFKLVAFAHMPYICNLASYDDIIYEKSKTMLINNIKNCEKLDIDYLVLHLGSHLGKGVDYGIERICNIMPKVLEYESKVNLLLENSAGYRNSVGSNFSELGKIVETLNSDRIGVCFDTCHAFASGYDIRTEKGVDSAVEEFTSQIGVSKLKLVHLNDAKYPLKSGLDRHWHIGKGYIRRQGFVELFKNRLFQRGSFIMETPSDVLGMADRRNYKEVKKIIKEATGIAL